MFSDNTKEYIRQKLPEYVRIITKPSRGKDLFCCPLCGSGTRGTPTSDGAFHLNGFKWFCHACNRGGDIFKLYAEMNHLDTKKDFVTIVNGLSQVLNIDVSEESRADRSPMERTDTRPKAPEPAQDPDRKKQIVFYSGQMLPGTEGYRYITGRGFTDHIIKKYQLGYDAEKKAVTIPHPGTDYYTRRIINPEANERKYENLYGVSAPLFLVKGSENDIFFITEGQLDALSIIQAGGKNVIASPHYPTRVKKILEEGFRMSGAVIVSDRDPDEARSDDGMTPGERKSRQLLETLQEKDIPAVIITPPEGFKDANDILKADPKKLTGFLYRGAGKLRSRGFKPVNASQYIKYGMYDEDMAYFKRYKDRKTGFDNIDKYLRLYPGLATLTGSTSLGKTSFCVQLADQLTDNGETVLYFALEQLPIEIISKSLSRRYFLKGGHHLNNIDIKNGATDTLLENVRREYIETSRGVTIIECDFTVTADDIGRYISEYVRKTRIKPVIIIDYLQIISPPKESHFDDRGRIDDAIKKFKLLSREHELFILLISNMARSSYREKIGEDSFKESGLIEFTSDYLFGLQLAILENMDFFTKKGARGGEKDTSKAEKQNMIDEALQETERRIVFKSIKNRQGQKVFKAFFRYRPDYDTFLETTEEDTRAELEKKYYDNGFVKYDQGEDFPFLTV